MLPITDIVGGIELIIKAHKMEDWFKLIFQTLACGIIAFLIVGGGTLEEVTQP